MRHQLREVLGIVADFGAVIGLAVLVWGAFGSQLQPLLAKLPVSNVLLVVFGALLIALDIVVRVGYRRQPQSPSQTPSIAQPTSAAPLASPAPLAPEPEPRIFVDRTPEELTANFNGVTAVQGADRVARYLGNWLRVSGSIGDIAQMAPELAHASFADRSIFTYNVVDMWFRDKQWIDRLVLMSPGDQMTVVGRIEKVTVQHVTLENCEIEP